MRGLLILLLAPCTLALAQSAFPGAAALDAEIERAIEKQLIPGAVAEIGHNGAVVYRKAYGSRALVPKREPMTLDTIFDAASLTKVIATTSSLMKLFEEGKLRLNDPVTEYLPEFQGGHSAITVRNLMTHFSGLRPDLDLQPHWSGYQTGIEKALIDKPTRPPGVRFVYSDINFILLGEIVHRLGGKSLADYARQNVFDPLGMKRTRFQPPADWFSKIAPTELDAASNLPIRGVVHDETSRDMGGVAGHAGLFTTAGDLGRFAQMMLDQGVANGQRIFSAAAIEQFTTPQSPADQPILRGLGWDIDSPFSANRGELFPIGSYGHTGFTGTSIWIDPSSRTYVILLTNSVHPHRGKSLTSLRSRVATIAAQAVGIQTPGVRLTGYNETITGPGLRRETGRNGEVLTGLDVLAAQRFAPLAGKRIGLLTNQTGLSREGKSNLDLMVQAGVQVTPFPRGLTQQMLSAIDAVVFDIQDVGTGFSADSCTLLSSLEEAAKKGLPFFVLDRPNPITGTRVEGPVTEPDLESFVGCYPLPFRHGMTFGELASMANGERKLGANLKVIAMQGWERADWFDETGLTWVDPSPSLKSLNAATLYPGVGMLEASSNYSVGRGTGAPFEQVGADWIRGRDLARFLNGRFIPGVRVYPTRFVPLESNFRGREIEGVRFVITNRNAFDSVRFGLELGYALEKLYPSTIPWDTNRLLIANKAVVAAGKAAQDPAVTLQSIAPAVEDFLRKREIYLIYK